MEFNVVVTLLLGIIFACFQHTTSTEQLLNYHFLNWFSVPCLVTIVSQGPSSALAEGEQGVLTLAAGDLGHIKLDFAKVPTTRHGRKTLKAKIQVRDNNAQPVGIAKELFQGVIPDFSMEATRKEFTLAMVIWISGCDFVSLGTPLNSNVPYVKARVHEITERVFPGLSRVIQHFDIYDVRDKPANNPELLPFYGFTIGGDNSGTALVKRKQYAIPESHFMDNIFSTVVKPNGGQLEITTYV